MMLIVFLFMGKDSKTSTSLSTSEYKLFEYHSNYSPQILQGIVQPESHFSVSMNISGKLEEKSTSLKPGTHFKKGDILLKLERLDILYQIVIQRLEFKKMLLDFSLKIQQELPEQYSKWENYQNNISHKEAIPELPEFSSETEKNIASNFGILKKYYETKLKEDAVNQYFYVAPFDGIILENLLPKDNHIQAKQTLLYISPSQKMALTATIPVVDITSFQGSGEFIYRNKNKDTVGSGKIEKWMYSPTDTTQAHIYFSISNISNLVMHESYEIISNQKPTHRFIPTKAIKENRVLLYQENGTYLKEVKIINTKKDSAEVVGLPSHCFIIIP